MDATRNTVLTNVIFLNPSFSGKLEFGKGNIVIEGRQIKDIVESRSALKQYFPYREINLQDYLVVPGFVNLHAHLRPLRAYGDGLGFKEWHVNIAELYTKQCTDDDAYFGAAHAFMEMLKNGVTTVMAFSTHFRAEWQAALDTGIRAIMVPAANSEKDLEPVLEILRTGNGQQNRVKAWLGVESANRCSVELLLKISKLAREYGVGLHTHFSEVRRECLKHLLSGNFLQYQPAVLAHCIHVDSTDIHQFKKYGTGIATNPKSNARLGNGVAPIPKLLSEGLKVGIGTDGSCSSFSQSYLEELRTAVLLQRAFSRNPKVLTSAQVLHMATLMAAMSLKMENMIGLLEPGKQADLVAVKLKQLHLTPHICTEVGEHLSNLPELLVHSVKQSDVELVMVAGEVVLCKGRSVLMDESKIMKKVQDRFVEIFSQEGSWKKNFYRY